MRLSPANFKITENDKLKFDFLMSLGSFCRTRYQLERMNRARNPDWHQPTHFFDWLMCGGLRGAIRMMESDFALNAEEFCCDDFSDDGDFIPLHKPSDFRFLHDLGCSKETRKDQGMALKAMHDSMDDFLAKYRFIGTRTSELLHGKVSLGLVYHGEVATEDVSDFIRLMKRKYNRSCGLLAIKKRFRFINVLDIKHGPPTRGNRVMTLRVDDSCALDPSMEWQGCDASWSGAFKRIE